MKTIPQYPFFLCSTVAIHFKNHPHICIDIKHASLFKHLQHEQLLYQTSSASAIFFGSGNLADPFNHRGRYRFYRPTTWP